MVAGFFLYSDEMLIIDIVALVFTLIWALFGYGAVRQENKNATRVFLITSVLLPAYVVYKFVSYTEHPPDVKAYIPMIYLVGKQILR
jgi:membrane protein implicated in regulation of membrane protease activity